MRRIFNSKVQILDTNGDPVVGAKLTFYAAGTSNLLDTYSDYALTTPNTNPVITDSGGWVTIFLTPNVLYDYTCVDADDVTIYAKVTNISTQESPLTTKGDLYGFDTDIARIAVGAEGTYLKADAGAATGVSWGTPATDATLTTKGDIFTYDTAAARLPVGNDHSILVADSGETTGLKWVAELVRATSSASLVLVANTWTTVQCNTETQDSDAIYNNSTYTATISDAGWYSVFCWANIASSSGSFFSRLLIDGTDIIPMEGGSLTDASTSVTRYFAASTTIVFQARNTFAETIAAGALFQIRRLG